MKNFPMGIMVSFANSALDYGSLQKRLDVLAPQLKRKYFGIYINVL